MTKVRTWVGLDVHAAKVVACVVDAEGTALLGQVADKVGSRVRSRCVWRGSSSGVAVMTRAG